VLDILRETHRQGARHYILMNGHLENFPFLAEAVDLFLQNASDSRIVIISWWELLTGDIVNEIFDKGDFGGWHTEHAGIAETSLMQHFAPDLVRDDQIKDDRSEQMVPYSVFPPPDGHVPRSGVFTNISISSPEKGELIAKHVAEKIMKIANKEL
jgi:creatinine amidohydrolase